MASRLIAAGFHSSLLLRGRLFRASPLFLAPFPPSTIITFTLHQSFLPFSKLPTRPFCSNNKTAQSTGRNPKLVNFSSPDSDSNSDDETASQTTPTKQIDKSKLPPPYDPFSKKPAIEEPDNPKNLQEVFHKIRTGGLFNNAVKMFDGLSKDGLTHEALELFSQIKDKGHMPDVVAHTAVIEAYAGAGQPKEALKVYRRMLASGVLPNAYTYSVLIKGLAGSEDWQMVEEAKKYVLEMMAKGMKPNAGTYVEVFEAFARQMKAEEGREFLGEMKARGFSPDQKAAREVLRDRRGPAFRTVMDILFGK
ncbi:pentatricopeptide repeat-containing protein At4g38150-like [Diospyros lotus]|uniref:pentatricopeptide repeat-containing protein At4g38150-like n=1 Tax=Diospyros lotus TaxID=55363 RepID=UPI00224F4E4B|nr:pentatricopeptide repeat-containing protein At4g38150-like [Diospyros lotus]